MSKPTFKSQHCPALDQPLSAHVGQQQVMTALPRKCRTSLTSPSVQEENDAEFPTLCLKDCDDRGLGPTLTSYETLQKGLNFILMCTGRPSLFLHELTNVGCGQY